MPVRLRLSLLALLAIAFYQWSNGGGGGVRAALTVRNSSLASDTKMLLAFKAAVTADPYQRLASTWVQAGSPCGGGWYGVQCNSGGRVAVLKLESLGLQGALSPALGDLPYLVYLNLSWNLLSSAIPSALARLPLLKYLDLSNNLLSQALPPPSLPSLAHLFLHSNQLSGPLPPAIANSPALSILSLSNNNLSGPAPLAALSRLTKLRSAYLAYNSLSGPIPPDIRSLASLEILDLTGNFFYGSLPKEFGLLSNLEVLNLGGNDLNGTLPPQLGNCSRLSELRLNSNAFSGGIPTALCSKGTLTVLDLHDNLLNYSIPSSIGSCTRLRELNLRKNYLQNSIPAAIGTLQSLYTALDLSHNDLQGEIPPQIGDLDLISYVDLSYNMLTAEVPPSFGNCGRLTWLDLSNNNLTGSIPATFGNLDNLDHLDMSNNHLSGSIPSELGQLLSLQMLDLSFNKLSGELPSELENLNLSQLNLSYNMLVGPIPSSFLNFSSSAFQNNSALCGWAAENTCSPESPTQASSKRGLNGGLLAVSCLVITVLLLIGIGALFYMSRHPGVGLSSSYDSQKVIRARAFSKDALSVATEGFSDKNLVGEGKRFRVFKGYIDGMIVAVKQVKEELFEALRTNFSTEMEILSKAQHPNLLKVLGWCSSPDMLAVVLPFVRNGSLEMHLHPTNGIPSGLSFDVRLRIALGIANGLAYLHQAWEVNPVLHCQLKAKSIHLDDNLFPQMSNYTSLNSPTDFALSGVLSGYMAPG